MDKSKHRAHITNLHGRSNSIITMTTVFTGVPGRCSWAAKIGSDTKIRKWIKDKSRRKIYKDQYERVRTLKIYFATRTSQFYKNKRPVSRIFSLSLALLPRKLNFLSIHPLFLSIWLFYCCFSFFFGSGCVSSVSPSVRVLSFSLFLAYVLFLSIPSPHSHPLIYLSVSLICTWTNFRPD